MKKKKWEPQPIDPFNAALVLSKLQSAIDEMCYVSLQYRPSDKNNLTNWIARYASLLRKNPGSEEIKKELNSLLDDYEKKYSWINDYV